MQRACSFNKEQALSCFSRSLTSILFDTINMNAAIRQAAAKLLLFLRKFADNLLQFPPFSITMKITVAKIIIWRNL
jgi:hypothetical protein